MFLPLVGLWFLWLYLAKYIEMAWWTTFFYPFFSFSYPAYCVFALNDLDKAKAILKNVEVWDDGYTYVTGDANGDEARK